MKKFLLCLIFISGCINKKEQNIESIYKPPIIDLPEDDELDDLPEAYEEGGN